MPVRSMPPKHPSPLLDDLKRQLVREWKKPKKTGEPLILEDSAGPRGFRSIRVYVIWAMWGELSQQERSEIIMDAFEKTHSQQKAMQVTVAMGLTPPEADRMQIPYK